MTDKPCPKAIAKQKIQDDLYNKYVRSYFMWSNTKPSEPMLRKEYWSHYVDMRNEYLRFIYPDIKNLDGGFETKSFTMSHFGNKRFII